MKESSSKPGRILLLLRRITRRLVLSLPRGRMAMKVMNTEEFHPWQLVFVMVLV